MPRHLLILVAAIALSACASQPATRSSPAPLATAKSETFTIKDLKEAETLAASLPLETTLVVFDIDDTLLTTPDIGTPPHPQFFGSDRWYVWQNKELKEGDADKLKCLFDIIAINYELGTQKATQPDAPDVVARIANDKMLLTSRSPNFRGATVRELRDAHYAPIATIDDKPDAIDGEMFVIPEAGTTRMTYADGIFMTRGYDKGEALIRLLERVGKRDAYSTVILVDDGQSNIDKMKAALAKSNINYYGLRYEGIKTDPPPAVTGDELTEARASWQQLRDFFDQSQPARGERLRKGQCGP
jgi:hypothetical protein